MFSMLRAPTPSNRVFEVDLRKSYVFSNGFLIKRSQVALVASLLEAKLSNGMSRLVPHDDAHMLIVDSVTAAIPRLEMHTGQHSVVACSLNLLPSPEKFVFWTNGVHIRGDRVYFATTT